MGQSKEIGCVDFLHYFAIVRGEINSVDVTGTSGPETGQTVRSLSDRVWENWTDQ